MSRRSDRAEKQLLKIREKLQRVMVNYPDGKITDMVGATTVYDLMNRAVVTARRAGYTDDQITQFLHEARNPPEPTEPSVDKSDVDPCAPGKHKTLRKGGKCHDIHSTA